MKRLGLSNQELNGFNIDENLEEQEERDKFQFESSNMDETKKLDVNNSLIKISKNKLRIENSAIETIISEKVTEVKSINDEQPLLKEPSLKLSSNFKETIGHNLSENSPMLETKIFMSKEIVEEIDTHKNETVSLKEEMIIPSKKQEIVKISDTKKIEYNHENLKLIAQEAVNIKRINTEANQTLEINNNRKQSVISEDGLKTTAEYVSKLQEDYKNVLWQKEKMDEEREELERAKEKKLENTQKDDSFWQIWQTWHKEKLEQEPQTTQISTQSDTKSSINETNSSKLQQESQTTQIPSQIDTKSSINETHSSKLEHEPQTTQISTQSDTKPSINETNFSSTNESKSSNTFTIK